MMIAKQFVTLVTEQECVTEPKQHWSDCAMHNEPAYPNKECDCGGFMNANELADDLNIKASMINLGEKIAWGSDSGVMDAAATMLRQQQAEIEVLKALVHQRFDDGKRLGVLETEDRLRKAQEV